MPGRLEGVRIVVVNNFPGPGMGGGEVQALAVVRGLIDAGAQVTAVVVPGSGFGPAVQAAGGTFAEAPLSLRALGRATRAIAEQIAGDGPVVAIGTGYWTNLLVRRAAGRKTGARVVNIVGVTPGASRFDGGSRVGLSARRLADRATSGRVDRYAAVAEAVAAGLIADGADARRVRVVPNGVDVAALRAQAAAGTLPPLPEGRPLVACAARLEPVKGVGDLVRAAAELPGATIAIAGDGPLASQLRELAVAHGVADRVRFLGRVSPIEPLLAAADIVALPSLSEGMPIVALEAMALGRPVVATNVGGVAEAVEDGVTGLLVAPSDPSALAAAIRRLGEHSALASAMGEAGAARVEALFTEQRMAAAYVDLVAELVAEAAPA